MTSTTKTGTQVLKSDGLGRVKTPLERREQLLDEFDQSGLSAMKFAQLTGVKYSTFAAWQLKRRKQRQGAMNLAPPAKDPMQWLEAVVEQAHESGTASGPGIVLELGAGARVPIHNANQAALAAALVVALKKSC